MWGLGPCQRHGSSSTACCAAENTARLTAKFPNPDEISLKYLWGIWEKQSWEEQLPEEQLVSRTGRAVVLGSCKETEQDKAQQSGAEQSRTA